MWGDEAAEVLFDGGEGAWPDLVGPAGAYVVEQCGTEGDHLVAYVAMEAPERLADALITFYAGVDGS